MNLKPVLLAASLGMGVALADEPTPPVVHTLAEICLIPSPCQQEARFKFAAGFVKLKSYECSARAYHILFENFAHEVPVNTDMMHMAYRCEEYYRNMLPTR